MKPKLDPERSFFNKWEMYKIVKEKPVPYFRIPYTDVFSLQSLNYFLNTYDCVFVKSVSTWGGDRVSKITKEKQQLIWKLQGFPAKDFSSTEQLFLELAPIYQDGLSIIQEGAPLLLYKDRPIDIRAHMQRELDGKWVYAGDLIRVGGPDSIVSNFESNGTVEPTDKVLLALFESRDKTASIMNRLVKSAMHICNAIDEHDTFMEAGIDFGVDSEGNLWLIEVNTNDVQGGPDKELFKRLPNQSYYEEIMNRSKKINEETVKKLFEYFEVFIKNKKNDEE